MITQNVTKMDNLALQWQFENGSSFWTVIMGSACPPTEVVPLTAGLNSYNAENTVYVDSGIAVQRTAMGASRNVFTSRAFSDLVTQYGGSLNSTTQCVPVLKSNPFKCDRDTTKRIKVRTEDSLDITVNGDVDSDQYGGFRYYRNLSRDNVMANMEIIGTDEWAMPDTIGLGSVEFSGYTREFNATSSHANDLALIMGEQDQSIGLARNSLYLVQCTIEPRGSFEYREVTMLLNYAPANTNNHTGSSRLGYTRSLIGSKPCIPATEAVGWPHYAAIATSIERFVDDNRGTDNYFTTIKRVASRWGHAGPPFAFSDSRNSLEDTLGVIAALGVSTMTAMGDDANSTNNSIVPKAIYVPTQSQGESTNNMTSLPTAAITVSGLSLTALILSLVLIPQVLTLACLIHLFLCSFRSSWQPGGAGVNGYLDVKSHHSKRPNKLVAESLAALVSLGGKMWTTPKTYPSAMMTPSLQSSGGYLTRQQTGYSSAGGLVGNGRIYPEDPMTSSRTRIFQHS